MPGNLPVQKNDFVPNSSRNPSNNDKIKESVRSFRIHTNGKDDETGSIAYPDRPGEPDCTYYLRTGTCGYGDDCKFNHPAKNVQSNQHGGNLPERTGEPDCAYFLKTGTCKYGSSCKYNHPHDRRGAGPVVLNVFGLPIRQGEESCTHYLRTGSCKFGVACKFHHPEPVLENGPNPPVSGPMPHAPCVPPSGGFAWPYLSPQTYLPILPSLGHNPGWSPSLSLYIGNMSPAFSSNGLTSVDHVYPSTPGSNSNLPVRPGEQECRHFMNTGTCKYGSDCKYHHPRENLVKTDASSFGPFGLPLRPGQSMCAYYMLYGICKFGPGCKYDHPLMIYSYNYIPMVDPSLVSYGGMNSSDSSPSKSMKNASWTSEQIGGLKLGSDDSSGSSSLQNQSD